MPIKPLTKDDVELWQNRIKMSKKWREPYEKKWKRTIGYLKGVYFTAEEEDQISVNLVHPMVRIIIPAIYSRNPDVLVIPRRKSSQKQAETMQKYLRYLLREIGIKKEVKLALLDALLCGHGWLKTGYQGGFDAPKGTPKKTVIQAFMEKIGVKKPENESTFAQEPSEKVIEEMCWAARVSPFDIFVPPYSSREDELAWMAHRFVWPIADIKNNPRFENTKDFQASTDALRLLQERDSEEKTSTVINDEDLQYGMFYEIYDARENSFFIIADNQLEPLRQAEENPYDMIDSRFPFDMLRFNDVTDEFYPMNDVEPWEPQAHELNNIRSQMVRHRKRYNRRYVYKEGAFKEEELEKLKSGEDGAMAATDEDDVRTTMMPLQDANLPPDTYQVEARIKDDITNISGITDYQRGNISQGAKTATEANIVESQSKFRTAERLDAVGTCVNSVVRKLAQISQALLPPNQIFAILDEDAMNWVNIPNRRMIRGEFDYEIIFGSSAPINKDVEKEQFKELYAMISQDPAYDPVKVRVELLKRFDIKAPEEWINPQLAQLLRMNAAADQVMGGSAEAMNGNRRPATSESRVPSTASERQKITKKQPRVPGGTGGRPLGPV